MRRSSCRRAPRVLARRGAGRACARRRDRRHRSSPRPAKPRTEAIANELYTAVDHATWLAKHAPRILRDERVRFPQLHLKTKKAWLVHEPLGVVAAITPWNIPFAIPFTQVATAVAAGNGVVLKPSELTPLTGDWVARVFEEAGAPAGLVQVAHGEGELGEAIVDEPGIAKVFFTGSVGVGRRVAAAAGARGIPVVLELGGKDPMVVFADADLDRAVDGALFASFVNAGQACVSAERIYVEQPLRRRVHAAARPSVRASFASATTSGRSISERQRDAVERISGARARRARGLVRRADGDPRRAARRGDLRARRHRRAVRRRGRRGALRERHASSALPRACGRAISRRPTASHAASRRAWCGSTTSATRSRSARRRGAA